MKDSLPSASKAGPARWLTISALILLLGLLFFLLAAEFSRAVSPSKLAAMASKPTSLPTLVALGACLALIIAGLFVGLSVLAFSLYPHRFSGAEAYWINWRNRFKWLCWAFILLILLFPIVFLLYSSWGDAFSGPYLRLVLLLSSSVILAALLPVSQDRLISLQSLASGIIFISGIYAIGLQFTSVVDFPFSLTWSEGNRLFEYSLYFGKARYQVAGELEPIRGAVGRYMLWGLPFLIPEAPIWLHRLWNAILSTAPHLILGLSLARWSNLPRLGKIAFGIWVFLFLLQGPIYTPLILSALLVVWFVHPRRLILSILAAAVAGFYASLSRWTWLPAVPVWAGFILLADYALPERGKSGFWRWDNLRQLLAIALVSLSGLLAGALANPRLLMPQDLTKGTSMAQPLLWYRLFPNATYPEGVLGAFLMACLPLIILLIWLVWRRKWPLNWVQQVAFLGASLVFLIGGLVISVKIGGGNNLHNMDMFLVTLAILAGLALRGRSLANTVNWPVVMRVVLALTILFPAWSAVRSGSPIHLPSQETVSKALAALSRQVAQAQKSGEVLFMDQRQLLTFGNIQDVSLVNEYEKKYMMDQAMAGDQAYFEQFYRDLADRRFSLIVSEPLFTRQKDSSYAFGEENNAWVRWVAEPLLCYYSPVRRIQNLDIQLFVPRENPQNCP